MYIPEDCEGASGCESMKVAVWFDMLGMIFWFSSAVGKYPPPTLLLRYTDIHFKVACTCSGRNDTAAPSTLVVVRLSRPGRMLRFLC